MDNLCFRPQPCDSSSPTQRYDREESHKLREGCNKVWPQVFLSHSGKQKNFSRHLFREMERENISCFFDQDPQSLPMAEEFPSRIFEAAKNCKVAVVVLSIDFISTKWPMLELAAFVKARNSSNTSLKILPLFYQMSPEALAQKLQKKDLIKSWKKLQKSSKRPINIEEWMKALEALRKLNGPKYIESEGEVAYINKIVANIRDILPRRLIYEESHVQGRERLCQEVAKLLEQIPCVENGVRIAGLYGVGGLGKTTIARILCNFYSKHFNGRVLHVELGRGTPMESLKDALKILCGASEHVVNSVMSIEQGWPLLQERMYGRSVFLALDNISDLPECTREVQMYLEAVCRGNGSIILLTARSLCNIKRFILKGGRSCMHVPFLQEEEAIAVLLKLTPLKLSDLTTEQKNVARKCLQKCFFSDHYHPLALQVLGAFLYDKFQCSWADLSRWIDTPNISWRDEMQKVLSIFKESFRSLLLDHRKIFMLLSLYLPSPSSHMTLEKAFDWLAMVCSKQFDDIHSAVTELWRKGFIEIKKEFQDVFYIHDLLIEFAESEADGKGKWIYLKGKDEIPSCLQEALSNDRPRFSAMKFENCYFESPGMTKEELFTDVLVLHLKDTRTPEILDLSCMKIVRSVTIIACRGLQEIRGLESLSSLAHFVIDDCPANVQFSPGIQCLRALRHLKVYRNLHKTTIRSSEGPWSSFPPFQDTSNVVTIRLDHSQREPGRLYLGGCSKLETIKLSNCDITLLDLSGCLQLRHISVVGCRSLIEIRLCNVGSSATNLLARPGCAHLESVPLERVGGLRELPSLSGLPNLSSLTLQDMGSLRELSSLSGLPNLSSLILRDMGSLRELLSLSGLHNLSSFTLWNMGSLRELPSFGGLPNMRELHLGINRLGELPGGLPNVSSFDLWGILSELPTFSGLPNLTKIRWRDQGSGSRELSTLSELPNLSELRLAGVGRLREHPSLSGLPNLTSRD